MRIELSTKHSSQNQRKTEPEEIVWNSNKLYMALIGGLAVSAIAIALIYRAKTNAPLEGVTKSLQNQEV